MNRRDITAHCTRRAAAYWAARGFANYFEMGLIRRGRLRGDLISINTKGRIVLTEVKSCWADFVGDTKWHKYCQYVDLMYFCIPLDLWESRKTDITKIINFSERRVGLIAVDVDIRVKKVGRTLDLSEQKRLQLLTRLAWRGGAK